MNRAQRGAAGRAAAVLLVLCSVVVAVVLVRHADWDRASSTAALVGLPLVVAALCSPLLFGGSSPMPNDPDSLAGRLADAVAQQWAEEAEVRSIHDPYPLPVRLKPTDPRLFPAWTVLEQLGGATGGKRRTSGATRTGWARSHQDLLNGDQRLVSVFDRIPTRRLVVLGAPGSGKTTLVLQLVLDLLASRRDREPVPVIVAAAGWNPAEERFTDWLRQVLSRDYPFLTVSTEEGRSRFDVLLTAGKLLPVVDGLDEMAEGLRTSTLRKLNEYLRSPGRQIVVTCRTREFKHACRPLGREVTLSGAAGVGIRPLDGDVVADYLKSSSEGPVRAFDWLDVREALLRTPPTPIALALQTPLMASMAREIYNPVDPDLDADLPDPSELLDTKKFPDVTDLEAHLLDAYVQAAYRARSERSRRTVRMSAEQAERWLVNLAHHQQTRLSGAVDIRWWQFDQAVPHALRAFLGAFIGGIKVGASGRSQDPARGVGWLPGKFLWRFTYLVGFWLLMGAFTPLPLSLSVMAGISVGVVSGVVVATKGQPVELPTAASPTSVLATDRKVFWLLGVLFGLLSGALFGVALGLVGDVRAGVAFGLVAGLYAAAALGMGKAAWGWFAYARWWLFLHSRMPLRMIRFMRDAHRRGVLRQVGAVWQFRHIDLQRRLASRHADR
ncbi:NACHT domain-containing protein [Streptomyces nigra]|uniref:NACHT domain-containing protein n=1 Tax=Streptomyces nigra TaxID=1827580 RepID=UPI0036A2E1FE